MKKIVSRLGWVLLAILLIPWLMILALVLYLRFTNYELLDRLFPPPTPLGWYPQELLDGQEDRLADLVVVGLPLSSAWEYQAPTPIDRAPLYRAGHIVLHGHYEFWALKADSGIEAWRYWTGNRIDDSYPHDIVILDEVVAFQTIPAPSPLHVIDLTTGRDLWETLFIVRGVGTDDKSRLFIPELDAYQALDAVSGEVTWVSEVKPQIRTGFALYDPSTRELYGRDMNLTWVVMDGETGELLRELNGEMFGDGGPLIVNEGVLFCEEYSPDRLFAVDGRENKLLWTKDYSPAGSIFTPMAYENTLYTRTLSQALLALDLQTGDVQWQYPNGRASSTSLRLLSNLVVLDGVLYGIFSDARLRGFDPVTGQEIGHIQFVDVSEVSNAVTVPGLAASEDMLFVSLGKTKLYAFRTAH